MCENFVKLNLNISNKFIIYFYMKYFFQIGF